jgi:hypothetical protein
MTLVFLVFSASLMHARDRMRRGQPPLAYHRVRSQPPSLPTRTYIRYLDTLHVPFPSPPRQLAS